MSRTEERSIPKGFRRHAVLPFMVSCDGCGSSIGPLADMDPDYEELGADYFIKLHIEACIARQKKVGR